MKIFSIAAVSFLLLSLIAGCSPDYLYKETKAIENYSWSYEKPVKFQYTITDTMQIVNMLLELEHAASFSSQNLYVKIKTRFPSGGEQEQVVSLELADKAGQWQGDCSGEWCKVSIPLQTDIFFNNSGTYHLTIEQYMRQSPIAGIKSFTLTIEPTGKQKGAVK